jgi:hypothetical protein
MDRYVNEAEGEPEALEGDTLNSCDDVLRAVESYSTVPLERRVELRRQIIRRHRELDCSHPLPEAWT